jgi:3-oxoacyl-[acyl-carrier protein] reductase
VERGVALVTGGASGIGAATCAALAERGASVAVVDINQDAAANVANGLDRAVALQADVSDSSQVEAAFRDAQLALGRVGIVVNAAGIDDPPLKQKLAAQVAAGEPLRTTADMSDEQWRRNLAVNLDGAFYVLRAALREMLPQARGAIVLVGSEGGINGTTGNVHYAAAKAGVHNMVRSVAAEVAAQGVRVNCIAPGLTRTPMTARTPDAMWALNATPPIGRWGEPEDIAAAICFLVGPEAAYVIGETMLVNGGRLTI